MSLHMLLGLEELELVGRQVAPVPLPQHVVLVGVVLAPEGGVAAVIELAVWDAELQKKTPDVCVVPVEDGMNPHEGGPSCGARGKFLHRVSMGIRFASPEEESFRSEVVDHVRAAIFVSSFQSNDAKVKLFLALPYELLHLFEAFFIFEVHTRQLFHALPSLVHACDPCHHQVQQNRSIFTAIEAYRHFFWLIESQCCLNRVHRLLALLHHRVTYSYSFCM
mmetsp:Transcript_12489/g.43417  ORF Transcript_12489/g.43417 Transcript_12489/m.43417 type:complete len:221 (+) Transcript_12489:908-1570(+)